MIDMIMFISIMELVLFIACHNNNFTIIIALILVHNQMLMKLNS